MGGKGGLAVCVCRRRLKQGEIGRGAEGLAPGGDDLRSQKGPNSHNERLERSQIRLMGEVLCDFKLRKSSMGNFDRKYRGYLTVRRSAGSCRVG